MTPGQGHVRHPSRLLLVGCGPTGASMAAALLSQGHRLTVLTHDTVAVDAIQARGLRCMGWQAAGAFRTDATTALGKRARYDVALLAVRPAAARSAIEGVTAQLTDDAVVVSFAPGLCEPALCREVGRERLVGAVATWGAAWVEAASVQLTAPGSLVLGIPNELGHDGWIRDGRVAPATGPTAVAPAADAADRAEQDAAGTRASEPPAPDPAGRRLQEVAHLLEAVAPVSTTDNLLGARWTQLALASVIEPLGLLMGEPLGQLTRHRVVVQLGLELLTEAADVARAAQVQLEPLPGTIDVESVALTEAERAERAPSDSLRAKHRLVRAVAGRFGALRSRLLETRHRRFEPLAADGCEVIIARGRALGVPTPRQLAVERAVRDLYAGRAHPGIELIRRIMATSPPSAASPPSVPNPDPDPAPDPAPNQPDEPVSRKPDSSTAQPETASGEHGNRSA